MSDKRGLRAAALANRRAIDPATREQWDRALIEGALDLTRGLAIVAAYVPMPGEPGGPDLVGRLAVSGPALLLPVLQPDLDLDWARYHGHLAPASGPSTWRGRSAPSPKGHLREPVGPRLGPDAVRAAEIALVPALLVDHRGVRLGRGGGSFDRALARLAADIPVVAVLYDGELVDALPHEPHDRPVSAALTPSGLIRL
jgi:5-formyltetrahydrofolate cyclo-ligase